MEQYCNKCGTQQEQERQYCAVCGNKLEIDAIDENVNQIEVNPTESDSTETPPNENKEVDNKPKKKLTEDIIVREIKALRNAPSDYLKELLWTAAVIGLCFLSPSVVLLLIYMVFQLLNMILTDIKITPSKYHILDRACIDKRIYADEESNEYQLWFESLGKPRIGCKVDRGLYESTEIGDSFYLLYIKNFSFPIKCYRKSEWTMDE